MSSRTVGPLMPRSVLTLAGWRADLHSRAARLPSGERLVLCRTLCESAAPHHEVLHMPTTNPRLSVVLSPSLAATLAAITKETGESASSVVRGILDQIQPSLERMLALLRAAKAAQGQMSAGVAASLDRVVSDLEDATALADSRVHRAVRDLVSDAEAVRGRRRPLGRTGAASPPGGASAASTPVPVTRGSGGGGKAPSGSVRASSKRSVAPIKGSKRGPAV